MKVNRHFLFEGETKPVSVKLTPNKGGKISVHKYIVIHFTEGQSAIAAVNWLRKITTKLSAHFVIGRDGTVTQLVAMDTIAWHAGVSLWNGDKDLNRLSIGIELDNAGRMTRDTLGWRSAFKRIYLDADVIVAPHKHDPLEKMYGWHKYPALQIEATIKVCKAIIKEYGPQEILGHDDVAPRRKWDPGPAFPLEAVRKAVLETPE